MLWEQFLSDSPKLISSPSAYYDLDPLPTCHVQMRRPIGTPRHEHVVCEICGLYAKFDSLKSLGREVAMVAKYASQHKIPALWLAKDGVSRRSPVLEVYRVIRLSFFRDRISIYAALVQWVFASSQQRTVSSARFPTCSVQ